jgi:hypothetical protein
VPMSAIEGAAEGLGGATTNAKAWPAVAAGWRSSALTRGLPSPSARRSAGAEWKAADRLAAATGRVAVIPAAHRYRPIGAPVRGKRIYREN